MTWLVFHGQLTVFQIHICIHLLVISPDRISFYVLGTVLQSS